MAMEKGRELQGKYMILRQLGEGGEGNTYLAYDEQANRNVAVRECGEKPSESRLAAWQKMIGIGKLPGIAQIYEVWETEGVFYMALEYAEGKNGVEYLESHPQGMDAAQAMRMMAPVAEGLSILHDKGLLHRDISTDNLLIKGDGSALLCDPGLLCETQGESDPVSRVKNGFSPMEMYLADGRQGTWSDVYEYCATLSHLMTGQILPVPAMRKDGDPFAGRQINLSAASLNLLRAGLEVEWEKRLRDLKPFCRTEMEGAPEAENVQAADRSARSVPEEWQGVVEDSRSAQPPYVAQPQMRTMPVNTQNVMSLQPDNAMNAGHRKSRGDRGRIFGAVGIVALLLALVFGGFAFYQTKNDEDSDVAEEEDKKNKKKDDGDNDGGDDSGDENEDESEDAGGEKNGELAISTDELMEKYEEYLESLSKKTYAINDISSYKLLNLDDDGLPECFLGDELYGIRIVLHYDPNEDEVRAAMNHDIVYSLTTKGYGDDITALDTAKEIYYSENENIFYCYYSHGFLSRGKDRGGEAGSDNRTFYKIGADGGFENLGKARYIPDMDKYEVGKRSGVTKDEYEEYISDFGELDKKFEYQDMYYSLDKAYEKYLEGK